MSKFKTVNFNDKWPVKLLEHLSVMQVDQYKFWERERMAHMRTAIRPDDVILDIGTCDGSMSAVFASWLGEKGKIILVEPSPDFWPIIKAHWEANNLKTPKCYQALVFNETITPLQDVGEDGWPIDAHGEIKLETGFAHVNERPRLPIVKIDDLNIPHVDIITMDIEGSCYEALQGAEQTIKRDKPILFISVHPEMLWREHHHSPDDLLVMLTKWGYDMTYLAFDHEQHYLGKPRP